MNKANTGQVKVFFSYGHDRNEPIVLRLKADLAARGYDIWIDREEIKSGDDWRRKIAEGILASDAMLSFTSRHSVREPGVCLDELTIAVAVKGAQVQSVLLEKDVDPPLNVSYRQYIDMSEWDRYWDRPEFAAWYGEKLAQVIDAVDSPSSRAYAEEMLLIREKLHPEMVSSRKEALGKQFYCGRGWLRDRVRELLSSGRGNVLLLGSPGCGKSSFLAHEFVRNPQVGAIVFCEWDNPLFNNLDSISRSIAFQLASRMPDFRMRLLGILAREGMDSASYAAENTDSFRRYVVEPLKYLVDGDRPDTLILIDGIDELKEDSDPAGGRGNVMADILERYAPDFPAWLRFVISSRNDSSVMVPLDYFTSIQIDGNEADCRKDVLEYLTLQLGQSGADRGDIQKLADRCGGNFLYASLMADAVLRQGFTLPGALAELGSLGKIYLKNFDRTFRQVDLDRNRYYDALCALCVTREPVPLSTLKAGLGWNVRTGKLFVRLLEPYLSVQEAGGGQKALSFFHKSVIDWLRSEEADEYQIDEDSGREVLAEGCCAAYENGVSSMNDYELKYLLPSLEAARDRRLRAVVNDTALGDLLLEKAGEAQERRDYGETIAFARETVKIFSSVSGVSANNADGAGTAPAFFSGGGSAPVSGCGNAAGASSSREAMRKAVQAYKMIIEAQDRCGNRDEVIAVCQETRDYLDHMAEAGSFPSDEDGKEILRGKGWLDYYLGMLESKYSRWEEALAWYDASIRHYEASGDGDAVILSGIQKALCCRLKGDLSEGIRILKEINEKNDMDDLLERDPGLFIYVRMNLGYCYSSNSKYPKARAFLENCLQVVEKYPGRIARRYIAQTHFLMSVVEYAEAGYDSGIEHADQAIRIYSQIYGQDSVEICSALNEKGHLLLQQGNWQEARECFLRSCRIRSDYYGEFNLYTTFSMMNLAKAEALSGEREVVLSAVETLRRVLDIRLSLLGEDQENINIAMVYLELALAQESLGSWDEAARYARKARDIYHRLGNEVDEGKCLFLQGRAELARGDRDAARRFLTDAAERMRAIFGEKGHPNLTEIEKALEECG